MKSVSISNTSGKYALDSHMKAGEIERTNMCHERFIAERLVSDHVTSVGGVMGVDINKELLTSCRTSRSRYAVVLEEFQQARDCLQVTCRRGSALSMR